VSPPSLAAASRLSDADLTRLAQDLYGGQPAVGADRVEAAIAELDQERFTLLALPPDWARGVVAEPLDSLLGDTRWIEALNRRKSGTATMVSLRRR
jgi:hypothetical protein